MTTNVWLMCVGVQWKRTYNLQKSRIDGLGGLVKYYNVTIFSTLLLDFYGDDQFKLHILKADGVECNYLKNNVEEFLSSKIGEKWNPEEFMVGRSNLELEKHMSLWVLNVFSNRGEYTYMKVSSSEISRNTSKLVCNKNSILYLLLQFLY